MDLLREKKEKSSSVCDSILSERADTFSSVYARNIGSFVSVVYTHTGLCFHDLKRLV